MIIEVISEESSKTTATRVPRRQNRVFTASEKLAAILRVRAGATKASVARDIGVPESTLRGWCKNEDKIRYQASLSSPDSDESYESIRCKRVKLDDSNSTTSPVSSRPRPRALISPKFSPELNRSCSGFAPNVTYANHIFGYWNTSCSVQSKAATPKIDFLLNATESRANVVRPSLPPAIPTSNQPSCNYFNGVGLNSNPFDLTTSWSNSFGNNQRYLREWGPQVFQPRQTENVPRRLESPPEQEEPVDLSIRSSQSRNALDELTTNDNNVIVNETGENEVDVENDAVYHARMFLKWLWANGSPSVTIVQLNTFRDIVRGLEVNVERKNRALRKGCD